MSIQANACGAPDVDYIVKVVNDAIELAAACWRASGPRGGPVAMQEILCEDREVRGNE